MSTLSTINVKHPTSASNNIVLDNAGNVGIGTSSINARLVLSTTTNSNHLYLTGAQQNAIQFLSATGGSGFIIGRSLSSNNANDFFVYDLVANATRVQIDSSGNFLFNSGYGSAAIAYGCRAWVNFNGTGVVAIRASGNVSAVTDNGGTGDYTVNFTTAMPDINYAVCGFATATNGFTNNPFVSGKISTNPATGSIRINVCNGINAQSVDVDYVTIAIFR